METARFRDDQKPQASESKHVKNYIYSKHCFRQCSLHPQHRNEEIKWSLLFFLSCWTESHRLVHGETINNITVLFWFYVGFFKFCSDISFQAVWKLDVYTAELEGWPGPHLCLESGANSFSKTGPQRSFCEKLQFPYLPNLYIMTFLEHFSTAGEHWSVNKESLEVFLLENDFKRSMVIGSAKH